MFYVNLDSTKFHLNLKIIIMAKRKAKKAVKLIDEQEVKELENEIKEEDFKIDKYEASYISKGRRHVVGSFATVNDARKALDKLGAHNIKIKHVTK
jgi:hypothetical protein